jgi:hypothetical protein
MKTIKSPARVIVGALFLVFFSSCYEPTKFELPEETAPAKKFVDKSAITAFLGTSNVKIAYVLLSAVDGRRWAFWVDYNEAEPKPKQLKKPAGKSLHADSPILSPDGKWVAYTLLLGNTYEAYMQKLDENAEPILVAKEGADPHWWTDPADGALYIVYANTGKVIPSLSTYVGGKTFKQKVDLSANGQLSGAPVEIADKPMAGGLSLDGAYLVTAYNDAGYYNTASKAVTLINQPLQTCNASVSTDPAHPHWMLFLNFQGVQTLNNYTLGDITQHSAILVVDPTNTLQWFKKTLDNMVQWQDPEWTNKGDYIAALGKVLGTTMNQSGWDGYIIKMSNKEVLKFNLTENITFDETSTPYVWIGG